VRELLKLDRETGQISQENSIHPRRSSSCCA